MRRNPHTAASPRAGSARVCPRCWLPLRGAESACPTHGLRGVDDRLGEVIAGRWRLEKLIGVGSLQATVWAANDLMEGLDAAVKVCPPVNEEAIERMLHGTSVCAPLDHPNIARIYELGELDDGAFYCAMERLHGRTLARLLRRGPFTIADGLRVADRLLAALELLHASRVVHRDLKPDNVFIAATGPGRWRPVLLDFGIAVGLDQDPLNPPDGRITGTPAYMAPEQIRGEPADPRGDLYSLGVLLYRVLTGRLPFEGADRHALYEQHLHAPPPRLADARPSAGFPLTLEATLRRALAKEPADRWPSAAAMREALGTVHVELSLKGADTPQTRRLSYPSRSNTRVTRRPAQRPGPATLR